jgi:hypothetical protein
LLSLSWNAAEKPKSAEKIEEGKTDFGSLGPVLPPAGRGCLSNAFRRTDVHTHDDARAIRVAPRREYFASFISIRLLKNAPERVFALASKRQNIRYFLPGFVAPIGATDCFSLLVDTKHVRDGFQIGHAKKASKMTNSIVVSSSFSSSTSQRGRVGIPWPRPWLYSNAS